jgi:AmmeMemoRadiSam system protein A
MDLSQISRDELLDLARRVIRAELSGGSIDPSVPPGSDPAMNSHAGTFVSLHEQTTHRLRGCVGRLDATAPLYRAVITAAKSVLDDPRFVNRRVTADELPKLEIEITVTWPPQPAPSVTDFDPLNDGIYLTIADRGGCFLPQVARETGWDKPTLLNRLCTEKLGMPADAWKLPQAKLEKFHTLLIGPEAFEIKDSGLSTKD